MQWFLIVIMFLVPALISIGSLFAVYRYGLAAVLICGFVAAAYYGFISLELRGVGNPTGHVPDTKLHEIVSASLWALIPIGSGLLAYYFLIRAFQNGFTARPLLAIGLLLVVATYPFCKDFYTHSWDRMGGKKFDWLVTVSAPENYPMEIIKGDGLLSDGDSFYIRDPTTLHKGWGTKGSTRTVGSGLTPLPTGMEITFFSYTENVFYRGRFDLPHDKILALFKAGYYSPKKKAKTTYKYVMTGVAPGGVVAVWLSGIDKVTEVFYGKADKVDLPWNLVNDNPNYTREDYIRLALEETIGTEMMNRIEQEGIPFGRWDGYHKTYDWQPVINSTRLPSLIYSISYFNGEFGNLRYPLDESVAQTRRPIPDSILFIWRNSKGKSYWVEYYFDEAEIFDVFEKLSPEGETALQLELIVKETPKGRTVSSLLRNKDQAIKLERTRLESSPTGLTDQEIDRM